MLNVWYLDSYNWEWNIVVKAADIGCPPDDTGNIGWHWKQQQKETPSIFRPTLTAACSRPVFWRTMNNIVFAPLLSLNLWRWGKHLKNCVTCLHLCCWFTILRKSPAVCFFFNCMQYIRRPKILVQILHPDSGAEDEIQPGGYFFGFISFFWVEGENSPSKDFIAHLKWHIFHCHKFSWQALVKSEMDSGKEFGCISEKEFWCISGLEQMKQTL